MNFLAWQPSWILTTETDEAQNITKHSCGLSTVVLPVVEVTVVKVLKPEPFLSR